MNDKIEELIKRLTVEEKASLCSGATFWTTESIERLDIPSIMMTDGPHGLRKQDSEGDHLGVNRSVPATCFPPACGSCSESTNLCVPGHGVLTPSRL